jgi:protein-tyrosine-phosphatase
MMTTSSAQNVTSWRTASSPTTFAVCGHGGSASYAEQKVPVLRWCEYEPPGDGRGQRRLSSAPTRVLFVCQSHTLAGPMAEGLARHAFRALTIRVHSAGMRGGRPHACAVSALSEIGIGINAVATTSVEDLALERFDLVVSLGLPKLAVARHQMAMSWMEPMLRERVRAPDLVRARRVRDVLQQRVHALGAILWATNRA